MTQKKKILAFAGSARTGSLNKALARVAARMAEEEGAETSMLDLRDFPMPIYDGDEELESGLPEQARKFKEALKGHSGWIIASPEYNSSFAPLLKNALDWASRSEPGEGSLAAFRGKSAMIISASPGKLGGLRGLAQLRSLLGNVNVLVLPEQLAVGGAEQAFDGEGNLKDANQSAALRRGIQKLVKISGEY